QFIDIVRKIWIAPDAALLEKRNGLDRVGQRLEGRHFGVMEQDGENRHAAFERSGDFLHQVVHSGSRLEKLLSYDGNDRGTVVESVLELLPKIDTQLEGIDIAKHGAGLESSHHPVMDAVDQVDCVLSSIREKKAGHAARRIARSQEARDRAPRGSFFRATSTH